MIRTKIPGMSSVFHPQGVHKLALQGGHLMAYSKFVSQKSNSSCTLKSPTFRPTKWAIVPGSEPEGQCSGPGSSHFCCLEHTLTENEAFVMYEMVKRGVIEHPLTSVSVFKLRCHP